MNRGPKHLFLRRRTPRILIVLACVVVAAVIGLVGWVLLRPDRSSPNAAGSPSASLTQGPSATPSVTGRPRIRGVLVQVLNGTTRHRLAARTSDRLAKAGYKTAAPGNVGSPRKTTLIEYQSGFAADAAYIQRVYFPYATIQQSGLPFPSGADIAVLLGADVPR